MWDVQLSSLMASKPTERSNGICNDCEFLQAVYKTRLPFKVGGIAI